MSGFSFIEDMPISGYTNKKGVVTPTTTVKAHYYMNERQKKKFIGRVSALGSEPIPCPMAFITHLPSPQVCPMGIDPDVDLVTDPIVVLTTVPVVLSPHRLSTVSLLPCISKHAECDFDVNVDFFPL